MPTKKTELSPRAKKALKILADGGRFAEQLERDHYMGRDQFHYRLYAAGTAGWTNYIRGFGTKTFREVERYLVQDWGTSVSTRYRLRDGVTIEGLA